ncbi:MAG: glycosyltransferase [Candidatus Roizmanbacteria bacterium]
MRTHTLLIIGGHPTPALSVIDEASKHFPQIKIIFAGRKFMNASETSHTFEYDEVSKRGIEFVPVSYLRGWKGLITFLQALFASLKILNKYRPQALLSFGGYIALPFVCAAWLSRIPVYTHEQTAVMGTANQFICALAKKVFVSFREKNLDTVSSKYIYTGNPIRNQILQPPSQISFEIPSDKPILFVTGGNLGSHSINLMIFELIPKLIKTFTIVHQIGNVAEYGDLEKGKAIQKSTKDTYRHAYIPVPHLSSEELSHVFSKSSMVVSRSGANTFFELIATQKPCVLIPLPWSAHGEQRKHAQILANAGVGEVCEQTAGTAKLHEVIMHVFNNRSKYLEKYPTLQHLYVPDAAHAIIEAIVFPTT